MELSEINELAKTVTGSQDAFSSLLVIIAVSAIGIIVKIAYKGILNRMFSPKNIVTDTEQGEQLVPVTQNSFERKNTSLEERLSLRIKAMLEPLLQQNHECIVRLEQKVDNYHEEAVSVHSDLKEVTKEFHEHCGKADAIELNDSKFREEIKKDLEDYRIKLDKKLDNLNTENKT